MIKVILEGDPKLGYKIIVKKRYEERGLPRL